MFTKTHDIEKSHNQKRDTKTNLLYCIKMINNGIKEYFLDKYEMPIYKIFISDQMKKILIENKCLLRKLENNIS